MIVLVAQERNIKIAVVEDNYNLHLNFGFIKGASDKQLHASFINIMKEVL